MSQQRRAEPPACRLYAGGGTDLGLQRQRNEDCFAVVPELGLLVVADGVGGRPAGDVAAKIAVDTVREDLATSALETTWTDDGPAAPADMGRRLMDAIALANARIREQAQHHAHLERMATTIVVAVVAEGRLWVAHVGDSRAYLFRAGRITRLTTDHSIAEDEGERARHTQEALARIDPRILTRGLGISKEVRADVRSEELQPGDVVLVATDGLTSVVTDGEIMDVLDEHRDIDVAVPSLIDMANARGGPDNITVAIARWVA
jgi:PPM family protein phosphatase